VSRNKESHRPNVQSGESQLDLREKGRQVGNLVEFEIERLGGTASAHDDDANPKRWPHGI
jgi:hypothetical protein